MREFEVPAQIELPVEGNLAEIPMTNAVEAPDAVVYSKREPGSSTWKDVTAAAFWAEVFAVAKGIMAAGVQTGERVALMSRTRYEWTVLDFAIWTAGGVVVPVYETSSAEQVQWILQDSEAVGIFVETPAHAVTVQQVLGSAPSCRRVWVIDDGVVDDLSRSGGDVTDGDVEERRTAVTADSLASVIYTSGTTGRPKGCELTHGNFLFVAQTSISTLSELFEEDASTLLFLPLAHVFGRAVELAAAAARLRLGHVPDTTTLAEDLGAFQPTFIFSVPRVFEKVYNGANQKARAGGRGPIFDRAAQVAIEVSRARDTGGPNLLLRAQHALFDKLVYGKLRAALGGRVKYAVSGGAALGERLGHFYRGIGLTVLEGYGLTETSAPSTANTPDAVKIGTVGRPLQGTGVRIAEDGEVLLKGPHIFAGYRHNPDATSEVMDDEGWFHSGDLGEVDDDGFLSITGRKKDILVTAGGKNVAPAVLEGRITAHHLVSQCMVVGDGRPYIAALITLDSEALPAWAEQHGKTNANPDELAEDPVMQAEIQAVVDEANAAVSRAESIRRFMIMGEDWTEQTGHLTPSMKLKRVAVMKDHAVEIERLYETS
jgi:long-chain acyl-CoA synthetase